MFGFGQKTKRLQAELKAQEDLLLRQIELTSEVRGEKERFATECKQLSERLEQARITANERALLEGRFMLWLCEGLTVSGCRGFYDRHDLTTCLTFKPHLSRPGGGRYGYDQRGDEIPLEQAVIKRLAEHIKCAHWEWTDGAFHMVLSGFDMARIVKEVTELQDQFQKEFDSIQRLARAQDILGHSSVDMKLG